MIRVKPFQGRIHWPRKALRVAQTVFKTRQKVVMEVNK